MSAWGKTEGWDLLPLQGWLGADPECSAVVVDLLRFEDW